MLRSTSSLKYKKDVETLEHSYADALDQMRPIWFRSTAKYDNPGWGFYGLVAEEVAAIDPRLVHWGYQEDQYDEVLEDIDGHTPRRTLVLKPDQELRPDGVQYDRLTVLLLDKVQRLEARLAALETAKPN